MYLPRHFAPAEAADMHRLMRAHPLACLVVHAGGQLLANHIPLLWVPASGATGVLRGHVARANPLWRELDADGLPAVAVFQGPQAYISPSWYPAKRQTGKVVPTWNYAVVHAHGRLRAVDDARWVRDLVAALTAEHEGRQPAPWAVDDAPADYIDAMVAAVVGIEMTVERLEGKFKASQNQPEANRQGVEQGLRKDPATVPMADLVRDAVRRS